MVRFFLLPCFAFLSSLCAAETPAKAKAALLKGAAFMRSISAEGGYLWRYSLDLKTVAGEVRANRTTIWMQPPGTPSMGMAFLKTYRHTGERRLLDHAMAAGAALAASQLESGGWDYRFDFSKPSEAKRRNISTFDDNTSQSVLRFLLALGEYCNGSSPRERAIKHARDYGLAKLLEAQFPNGAWPQRYDGVPKTIQNYPVLKARFPESWMRAYPKEKYIDHYTFNDNSHRDCVLLALEAHRVSGEKKFLEAAVRGGDFILLAQMPAPQPAWAQQYNASMEPAWARKFEPPSITGGESVGACRTLIDLHLATGKEKYLTAAGPAVEWFLESAIAKNQWARFYELKTNRPLYFTKDYRLTYQDNDMPTHYSFQSSFGVADMIRFYKKVRSSGREAYLASQNPRGLSPKERTRRATALEKHVLSIISAQDKLGRWITEEPLETRGMNFNERIETRVFMDKITVLSEYLSLVE
jgi:hypothetical protein